MFAGRRRGIHLDRTVTCNDRLSGRSQDGAPTPTAAGRGLNERRAQAVGVGAPS